MPNLKDVLDGLQETGKIELIPVVNELWQDLNAQRDQIQELKETIQSLKKRLDIQDSMIRENDVYWIHTDLGKDGPFCLKCLDDEGKQIHLFSSLNPEIFSCPKCKITARTKRPVLRDPKHFRKQ